MVGPESRLNIGSYRERLNAGRVEIIFADIERHAAGMAHLFDQRSAISHLSAMAPAITPPDANIRALVGQYADFKNLVATEDDIYTNYQDNKESIVPLVAMMGNEVVGTASVEKPGGIGLLWGGVARVVVAEEHRGKGIGKSLLRAADAYMFVSKENGGLACTGAQAGIIKIKGYEAALALFMSERYQVYTGRRKNCVSWNPIRKCFVRRNTVAVLRQAPRNPENLQQNLPKF